MATQTEPSELNIGLVDIPGTSLKASPIALGTWAIGGWMWGGADEGDAIRTIQEAVDRGITLIDTAPVYGFGRSEEIVGKALAEWGRRKHVRIATKVGLDWKNGKPFRNASRTRIHKEIEDSLRRLRTDVVDLKKRRQRWLICSAPARFERSASAISVPHRSIPFARSHKCIRLSRHTIFSSVPSSKTSSLIAETATSSRLPTDHCAEVCSRVA